MAAVECRSRVSVAEIAGPDWRGFEFVPFGRSRSRRLLVPCGDLLQAGELTHVRDERSDLCYLQARVAELESKLGGATATFTRDESRLVRVALQLILREIPVALGSRDSRVSPDMLVAAVRSV